MSKAPVHGQPVYGLEFRVYQSVEVAGDWRGEVGHDDSAVRQHARADRQRPGQKRPYIICKNGLLLFVRMTFYY